MTHDNGELFSVETLPNMALGRNMPTADWNKLSPEWKAAMLILCMRAFDNFMLENERQIQEPSNVVPVILPYPLESLLSKSWAKEIA